MSEARPEAGGRDGGSKWQSIETAPKDGRDVVLLLTPGLRVIAHWMPGGHCIEDHPAIDRGWYFWAGDRFEPIPEKYVSTMRWMPLPVDL